MGWKVMIIATTATVALCSATSTQSPENRASGRVADVLGNGFRHARVFFHPDGATRRTADTRLDVVRDTDDAGA